MYKEDIIISITNIIDENIEDDEYSHDIYDAVTCANYSIDFVKKMFSIKNASCISILYNISNECENNVYKYHQESTVISPSLKITTFEYGDDYFDVYNKSLYENGSKRYYLKDVCIIRIQPKRYTINRINEDVDIYDEETYDQNISKFEFNGVNILDALICTEMTESKGEGRRLIKQNGIKVDNIIVPDDKFMITETSKLSKGKKKHAMLIINKKT